MHLAGVPASCRVVEAISIAGGGYTTDAHNHGTLVAGIAANAAPARESPRSLPDPAYVAVTQQVYLAYFGRPADPGGLRSFANALRDIGAPRTALALEQAYKTNSQLRSLIDHFGNSAESAALYPGDNSAFVTAIFRNVLNRDPQAAGLAHWKGALDSDNLTGARAALSIMAGAMSNADGNTVLKKSAVANNFTLSLDLQPEINSYTTQKRRRARCWPKLAVAQT